MDTSGSGSGGLVLKTLDRQHHSNKEIPKSKRLSVPEAAGRLQFRPLAQSLGRIHETFVKVQNSKVPPEDIPQTQLLRPSRFSVAARNRTTSCVAPEAISASASKGSFLAVPVSPPLPPPVSASSQPEVKAEGDSRSDDTDADLVTSDNLTPTPASLSYVPGPASFIFVKYGDDQRRIMNMRCRNGIVMKCIREYLKMDPNKGELDLVNLQGELLGLARMDFNVSMERVANARETYIPCEVVTEDCDYYISAEPCLADSKKEEDWYVTIRETLDEFISEELSRKEQDLELIQKKKKEEEEILRKKYEKEMRELMKKQEEAKAKATPSTKDVNKKNNKKAKQG